VKLFDNFMMMQSDADTIASWLRALQEATTKV
jgi:hypothetical protein